MPRLARIAPKECVFHVLTRGNNRKDIFNEEQDYQKYLEILKNYKEKFCFKLYHYVLMTNHVHLVMELTENSGELADIMKGINLTYTKHYKRKYNHIGHFWQDRYKSIIVAKDQYLLACGGYIDLNPVRANIVDDPKDYKWSSYHVYAFGKKDDLTDEHSIYEDFSKNEIERMKKYREFVEKMLKERDGLRGEMDKKSIYGDKSFKENVINKYNIKIS